MVALAFLGELEDAGGFPDSGTIKVDNLRKGSLAGAGLIHS